MGRILQTAGNCCRGGVIVKPRNEAGPHCPSPLEPIPPGELWPLSFFHSRCRYGARALAAAIRAGLPVLRWKKRSWISTDDLIDFLRRHGRQEVQSDSESGKGSHEQRDIPEVSGNGCRKCS